MTGSRSDADYVLGVSAAEQERLRAQGDAVGPMTLRLLTQAGIGPGMRVLDVGCGAGDVSLLAARLVGASGEVVGVDREPQMVEAACRRAHDLALANVRFVEGDFREVGAAEGVFDAAVGRLVLMYQADAADAVQRLTRAVRPGGFVLFQEYDSTLPPTSLVPMPLHVKVRSWIWRTLERSGADIHMGLKLFHALRAAGLTRIEMRAEAIVATPQTRYPTVPLVRVLLPKMVAYGIASEQEVDIETLEARLAAERDAADTVYVGGVVFGGWGFVPQA
jgi:ubiquinone/menaquinone biosynthesis C-methylase UbiE